MTLALYRYPNEAFGLNLTTMIHKSAEEKPKYKRDCILDPLFFIIVRPLVESLICNGEESERKFRLTFLEQTPIPVPFHLILGYLITMTDKSFEYTFDDTPEPIEERLITATLTVDVTT